MRPSSSATKSPPEVPAMGRDDERRDYEEGVRGQLRAAQEKRLAGDLEKLHARKLAFLSWLIDTLLWRAMSEEERMLYLVLWTYSDARTGKCRPGRARIRAQTGLSQRAYYEARASLRDRGLLSWYRGPRKKGDEKKEMPVNYALNFDPLLSQSPGEDGTVARETAELVARGITASRGRRNKPWADLTRYCPGLQASLKRPSLQPLGVDVTGIGNSELVSIRKTPPDPPEDGGAERVVVTAAAHATAGAAGAVPPPEKKPSIEAGAVAPSRKSSLSDKEKLLNLQALERFMGGLPFPLQQDLRELEKREKERQVQALEAKDKDKEKEIPGSPDEEVEKDGRSS